jgi:tetratricopeptide (TPR) repeat protein
MRSLSFRAARATLVLLAGLLLGNLPGVPAAAQNAPDPAAEAELRQKFQAGVAAMHANKPEEAERAFREVTVAAPDFAEAHLELGMAEVRTGHLEAATQSIERALALNPKLPNANLFLGITYHQLNRTDAAIAAVGRELAQQPDNVDALLWMGVLELGRNDPEKAVGPLDRAAELAPRDANILDYRGRAHQLVSRNSYRAMYEVDPNSWRVHRLQGEMFADSFQYSQAAAEFERAIALAPGQADLYESLGRQYQKLNRMELAEKAFRKELALDPGSMVAMSDLGSVEVERGNAKEGVALLEKVVASAPEDTLAYYYLGRGQAVLGQSREAVASFERAIAGAPGSEIAERSYYQLGHLYRSLGRPAEADKAIRQFVALKSKIEAERARSNALWDQNAVTLPPESAKQ